MRYALLLMFLATSISALDIPLDRKYWSIKADAEQIVQTDSAVRFQSRPTLRIRQTERVSTTMTQRFKVVPNKRYRLTVDARFDNPYLFGPGFSGFVVRVVADNKEYGATEPLTMVRDWCRNSFLFDAGDREEFTLQIYTHKSLGTVWLGRLNVAEVTDPAEFGDVTPPDRTPLEPTAQEQQQGFITFQGHRDEQCYTTRRPRPADARSLTLKAARGEYEAAVLSVYALKELKNLEVSVSEPLTNGNSRIPAEQVEIRVAAPYQFKLDQLSYIELPFLLERNKAMDLQNDRSLRYFVTVQVREGTPSGEYRGKLGIKTTEGAATVDLSLQVYPFKLDDPGKAYFIYHTGNFEKRIIDDMAKHGMNTVTLYDNARLENGNLRTNLPNVLNLMREANMLRPDIPLIYLYMNRTDWLDDFVPPPDMARRLLDLDKGRNPPLRFYCLDEPMGSRIDDAIRVITKLKSEVPEVKTVSALDKPGLDGGLLKVYDSIIFTGMNMSREMVAYMKSHPDKQWFLYDCFQNGKNPLVDRYMYGVYLYASQTDGIGQWVYHDAKRKNESRLLIYYGYAWLAEDDVTPTLGWEAKREGIDDMRYIATLKRRLDNLRNSDDPKIRELLNKGDALLREIDRAVELDSLANRLLVQTGTEYRRDNQPQKNWSLDRLDNWREQIAQLIIALN